MIELADNLFAVADRLDAVVQRAQTGKIASSLAKVRDAAEQTGKAWSGGWLGYHSRVYYNNFEPVPAGAHFSTEWGTDTNHVSHPTIGDWCEYQFDFVKEHIFSAAKVSSLESAEKIAQDAAVAFQEGREEVLSALAVVLQNSEDAFLARLKEQTDALKVVSWTEYARAVQPRGQFMSRDMHALTQGIQTPPHLAVIARTLAAENPAKCCDKLAKIARRAASHLQVRVRNKASSRKVGTNVFIGHGRSFAWRDLKDFVQDRLGLPWDEFNRVPVAGVTNITRLSQMLEDAAIAFLILTGEDEQHDATLHPRLNVVHEAGLFQGHLGFTKAIVLVEEGCEAFSNIDGLGQIRFPKGNIKAAFEEIRRVLERECLIEG